MIDRFFDWFERYRISAKFNRRRYFLVYRLTPVWFWDYIALRENNKSLLRAMERPAMKFLLQRLLSNPKGYTDEQIQELIDTTSRMRGIQPINRDHIPYWESEDEPW
jgi:hypothetical protein